jgi:hypothetical protein
MIIKKNELSEYSLVEITNSINRNFLNGNTVWFKWKSKRPKVFILSTIDGKKSIELRKDYLNRIKKLH